MPRKLLIPILIAVSVASKAEVADTAASSGVMSRIELAESGLWRMTPDLYINPAMKQWMLPVSVSAVNLSYADARLNRAVYRAMGEGSQRWMAGAESYMKYRSSTLWGSATYSNGKDRNPVWNESSDLDLIYPYVVADSIGGDIKAESYALSGGYADHTDRWAWGATISYKAGLNYRNVDPRPRNVTGRLDLSAAGAWRVPSTDYRLGLSAGYMRYKQSADITFVNDLADNRIWHLTGLGTHYERFTGQGYSHSYQGHRLSGSLDLLPQSGRGVSLSAGIERFAFDHILTSLNNMPLQSASETMWRLEASWLRPGTCHDLAATLSVRAGSREGTENIFGDAAAGIYPKIGELTMYRHSISRAMLRALWQWHPSKAMRLAVEPRIGYSRSRQTYADPWRLMQIGTVDGGVDISFSKLFGSRWRLRANLSAYGFVPSGCRIDFNLDGSAPLGMQKAETDSYDILSSSHWQAGGSLAVVRSLTSRYALMLKADYRHGGYDCGVQTNDFVLSFSFIF